MTKRLAGIGLWLGLALRPRSSRSGSRSRWLLSRSWSARSPATSSAFTLTEWVNFLAGFGAILLTFLAGTEIDRAGRPQALPLEHEHRRGRLPRALPRAFCSTPTIARLAVAAGADRRHFALDHLGGGRLRGHGRDRLQQDRNRQDHPRRLLRERPRHRAGARHRLRPLRPVAGPLRRRDSGGTVAPAALRAMVLRQVGHRVSEPETKFVALVLLGLGGLATSPAARRCCRPTSLAWRWRRPSSPTPSCRTACASLPSPS